MSGCLSIIRWFLAFILSLIFITFIILAVVGSTISTLAANPATVKTWASDLGLYEHALDIAVISMREAAKESPYFADLVARYDLPNSELKRIAVGIAEPTLLKKNVETVVDAIYAWLNGETARPEFEVAIVQDKQLFADALALGFSERILGMSECDSTFVVPEDFNPFAAECRPVGYGQEQLAAYFAKAKEDPRFNELLDKAVINSDTFVIDQRSAEYIQIGYRIIQFFPLVALLILALLGLLLWWIIPGKRRAVVIIGILFILTGIALGISALVVAGLFSNLFSLIISLMNGTSELIILYLKPGIEAIHQSIIDRFGLVSLVYVLLGILLVGAAFIRRKPKVISSLSPNKEVPKA